MFHNKVVKQLMDMNDSDFKLTDIDQKVFADCDSLLRSKLGASTCDYGEAVQAIKNLEEY